MLVGVISLLVLVWYLGIVYERTHVEYSIVQYSTVGACVLFRFVLFYLVW